MNQSSVIVGTGTLLAIALVVCGWLIRDGLMTVSAEVRNKQVAEFPEEVRFTLGNPEARVTLGRARFDGTPGEGGTLYLNDIRIDLPATRPTK